MHLQSCRTYTLTAFCTTVMIFSARDGEFSAAAAALTLAVIPRRWLWWPAAGIVFMCRSPDSGKVYILFGQEKWHHPKWCLPYGNSDPQDGGDRKWTACREAAEETCYALGPPRRIYDEFLVRGSG